jgi:hypothetical protein
MEQLKPVRQLEAGRVLGLGRLPSKTILWEGFYEAARQGLARTLLDDYFRHQLRSGSLAISSSTASATVYWKKRRPFVIPRRAQHHTASRCAISLSGITPATIVPPGWPIVARLQLSTEEATRAILSRWGASENTFKLLQDRHPWHYHPGFKLVDSVRQ